MVSFFSKSFKAVVSFDDFHANGWQAIVDGWLHYELNGGVGFIKFTIHFSFFFLLDVTYAEI